MSQVTAPFSVRAAAPAAGVAAGGPFPWIKDTTGNQGWTSLNSIVVNLYPSCGEAVAAYCPVTAPSEMDSGTSKWSELSPEYRDASNSERATTRSRGRMRRYMVHNRLVKMWVLTFVGEGLHGEDGYRTAQREMRAFIKRLRRDFFRGREFPYLWSIEPHPDGHGWHVNLMLQNVFINKHAMQRCWQSSTSRTNGNVWYTDFTKDREDWLGRPIGSGGGGRAPARLRTAAKLAATYASKYIGKDLGDDLGVPAGAHRYEVAQGFQPAPVQKRFLTFREALDFICSHPSFGWCEWFSCSSEWDGWDGPPVQVIRFSPPLKPPR